MGELGALFNPGMRHELEERRARAARREEEGSARDGDLRIDLESGVAVINAPGDEGPAEADGTAVPAAADGAAETETGSDSTGSDTDVSVTDDSATDHSGTDDTVTHESATTGAPAEAAPAPLRPRGKRAMSATRR